MGVGGNNVYSFDKQTMWGPIFSCNLSHLSQKNRVTPPKIV